MTEKKYYKITVFSDSHGNYRAIEKALPEINSSDYFIYLGDGDRDVDKLSDRITSEIIRVRGNCDIMSELMAEVVLKVGETSFFITHGNKYGVKNSLLSLAARARELGCEYALYGHTHSANIFDAGGVILINPGTVSRAPTYAVIKGDGKYFTAEIVDLK